MSIYATGPAKDYHVKVVLSDGRRVKVTYSLYHQHPAGWSGEELIEIDGVDRSGEPASIVIPERVLRHFLAVVDNEEPSADFIREMAGEAGLAELKQMIKERRGVVDEVAGRSD